MTDQINCQYKIEKDEKEQENKDLNFKGLHDHSRCIQRKTKIDHDSEVLESEGDLFEDFKHDKNAIDHSRCTTIWNETWEDASDNEDEDLAKVLLGQ